MKVYAINNLFLFGGLTKGNQPYLVIGKQLQPDPTLFIQLKTMLEDFTIPTICSAKMLDSLIAAILRKAKSRPFLIGCTIRVSGIAGPTGGVLGNPSLMALSAQGELEVLEDGWKLLSFPESPGLAFKEGARSTFSPEVKCTDAIGKELLLNLASQAYKSGVEEFLALTDGTGCGVAGSAIIQCGRDYLIWSLDEISSSTDLKINVTEHQV